MRSRHPLQRPRRPHAVARVARQVQGVVVVLEGVAVRTAEKRRVADRLAHATHALLAARTAAVETVTCGGVGCKQARYSCYSQLPGAHLRPASSFPLICSACRGSRRAAASSGVVSDVADGVWLRARDSSAATRPAVRRRTTAGNGRHGRSAGHVRALTDDWARVCCHVPLESPQPSLTRAALTFPGLVLARHRCCLRLHELCLVRHLRAARSPR